MIYKILKIILAVLGLAGIVSLISIVSKGDDAIKAAAVDGDTAIVEPLAMIAYVILFVAIAFVVIFVIKNLLTNTSSLKSTLIGLGAFLAVLLLAYVLSGGDPRAYFENGIQVSDGTSHMVGAGLVAFYVLAVLASVSILLSGVKKMIK
ncbi:hypothetical protein [Ichthyenterobacterium magnum]|uniref:Uncharacterized protein n=1 Tax=Ichthyenterobacterium magnum TaxID=1230530 RepID=A0A420DXT5_9FLAO|nr:hypothetical protein [Ichthyenterobacterium magnum]RKE99033.1 hypothetical protein BXY80_1134 [Ichthyenterobacterium magnum]